MLSITPYAAGDNAMNSCRSLHEDNILGQLSTFSRMFIASFLWTSDFLAGIISAGHLHLHCAGGWPVAAGVCQLYSIKE